MATAVPAAPTGNQPPLPTPEIGLTAAEVRARVERGQTNAAPERSSRSTGQIVRANLLTRFNLILVVLLAVILSVGDWQDSLFGVVPTANALIGIVQELRAKRTLDRLTLLNAPRATVIRDGSSHQVPVDEVVLDDLVELRSGDQVVADGVVTGAEGLQVDESLLTGEADPVDVQPGSRVLSGSFAVAGTGRFQATAVGAGAYAHQLTAEARRFTQVHSELRDGINRILTYATFGLVPAAILLLVSQRRVDASLSDAVGGAVAGLVAMVPQGLVLLTSLTFALAAITLAQRRVLVQELAAVEGLARVDVVCFDKTGTLTDGTIRYAGMERLLTDRPVDAALGALAGESAANATLQAVAVAFPANPGWRRLAAVPFSSLRKWSGAEYEAHGTWVLGAPEIVMAAAAGGTVLDRADQLAAEGSRVLLVAHTDAHLDSTALPSGLRAVALLRFEEHLRDDAAATLAYFTRQGVALKMMSGDSPRTLAVVARGAGIPGADAAVDARELGDDADGLRAAVEQHSVFGRVTPRQKQAMVRALQANGHTVAMTGDGVNDALALKAADMGVAMGSGAPATRGVAQLILLDSRFATLPGVVAEGRRVTANVERVSNLFVTKTVWAALLAFAIGFAGWPYPFLPRHLSIVDTLSIGVPAFVLALAPNPRRYIPGFVERVLRFTIPAGALVAVCTFTVYALARAGDTTLTQQRTAATIVALSVSLGILALLSLPLTPLRLAVFAAVAAVFAALFAFQPLRDFLDLDVSGTLVVPTVAVGLAGLAVLLIGWRASRHRQQRASRVSRSRR